MKSHLLRVSSHQANSDHVYSCAMKDPYHVPHKMARPADLKRATSTTKCVWIRTGSLICFVGQDRRGALVNSSCRKAISGLRYWADRTYESKETF